MTETLKYIQSHKGARNEEEVQQRVARLAQKLTDIMYSRGKPQYIDKDELKRMKKLNDEHQQIDFTKYLILR